MERYLDARARGAKIYGEVVSYAMNSDAHDFVMPHPGRQAECIRLALRRAGLEADDIDLLSTHATGTTSGDAQECEALRQVFNGHGRTLMNNTKGFIGPRHGGRRGLGTGGKSARRSTTACAMPRSIWTIPIPHCACPAWWPINPRRASRCAIF